MMVGIMQKHESKQAVVVAVVWSGGVESQTSLAGRRRLLRSTTAARRNHREEALNVNNTKSINEKKTEPDWQLFDQLLHYSNHNSPYGAAARVQPW